MPEINVSRKTVKELLSLDGKSYYTVPPYQRPYSWEEEQCQQLWDDILAFYDSHRNEKGQIDDTVFYFLGAIVTCGGTRDGNGFANIEIVDGQQRITTLSILLRALFKQISEMKSNRPVQMLKELIAPCLWKFDPMKDIDEIDHKLIHIKPQTAGTIGNAETFTKLLETGDVVENHSLYSKNYRFFQKIINKFTAARPTEWFYFIQTILNNCIIFPIACDTQDSALLIFNTLNSKGMPLEDSDIIKAYIYKSLTECDQIRFAEQWQDMVSVLEVSKLSTDHIFRVYMHILRAKNEETQNEIGLRSYFLRKNENLFSAAKVPEILDELRQLADFWHDISGAICDKYLTQKSRQYLHCLSYCTNDYWKYAISVYFYRYYMKETDTKGFMVQFEAFLQKLTYYMIFNMLAKKPVNQVKIKIYELNICTYHNRNFNDWISWGDNLDIEKALNDVVNSRTLRSILLLYAYSFEGQQLINDSFEIEHIYPKKGYTAGMQDYVEQIGNKIVIEKKINTSVGNAWFNTKKQYYSTSQIMELQEMSQLLNEDWLQDDITKRSQQIAKKFQEFCEVLK